MTRLLVFVAGTVTLSSAVLAQSNERCYFPDGSVDVEGFVCNSTAAASGRGSACCLHDDACYESGACLQDWSGVFYRRGCTDPTYRAPGCPKMCVDDLPDGAIWIQSCDMAEGKACCYGGDAPCCDGPQFDWKPGYIAAIINGDGTNRLTPYVDTEGNIKSDSIFTMTAMSSSERSEPTSEPTAGPSEAIGSGSTAAAEPEQTSLTPPVPADGSGGKDRKVAIAVGVVFGLIAVVAIGVLVFFLLKFKKERQQLAQSRGQVSMAPQEMAGNQPYGFEVSAEKPAIELDANGLNEANAYATHNSYTNEYYNKNAPGVSPPLQGMSPPLSEVSPPPLAHQGTH